MGHHPTKLLLSTLLITLAAGCASNTPPPDAAPAPAAAPVVAAPEPEPVLDPSLGAPFATKYARFEPTAFGKLPGWATDSQRESLAAFKQSCTALRKKAVWSDLCQKVAGFDGRDERKSREFFEDNFHAYSVLAPNQAPDGVITGYFEPLLKGSRTRGGRYLYPIYGTPADLLYINAKGVTGASKQWFTLADRKLTPADAGTPGAREYTVKLNDVEPNLRDKRFRVAIQGDTILPYYSRQELEARDIKAQVFAWVDDPYALYSMQVQGSGKIKFADGDIVRVAYAEQNGYPFLPRGNSEDLAAASVAVKTRGLKIAPSDGGGSAPATPTSAAPSPKPQNKDVADIIASLKGNSPAPAPAAAPPPPRPAAAPTPPPAAPAAPAAAPAAGQSQDVAALIAALKKPGGSKSPAPAAAPSSASSKPAATPASTIEFAETTAGIRTDIPDPSYVFFRKIPDGPQGPTGALGVPLTAGRSIAVDPRTTPLGYPVFLSVNAPDGKQQGVNRLMFAQDTGGAIRGPVRADFFYGFGQEAGNKALSMNNPGRMWLLIPRGVEVAALNPATRTRGPGGLSNAECVIPDDENCVEE